MSGADPQLDPFAPAALADPYPIYARLRATSPIHRFPDGSWLLTRYADVDSALRDQRFSVGEEDAASGQTAARKPVAEDPGLMSLWMTKRSPADHARLRTWVSEAFTAIAIQRLRPEIGRSCARLLDRAAESGTMDVVADFAYPLPALVIARILGVPESDHERLMQWAFDVARTFDIGGGSDTFRRAGDATLEFRDYFRDLAARRRSLPADDLVSALVAVSDSHGGAFDEDELYANCILLFFAGHETVTSLIGNGMLALLRHPSELRRLRKYGTLVRSAVEELLRFESPVHTSRRFAREDVVLDGKAIAKGQVLVLGLGAANRDPAIFRDPDRLDVARSPNPHLAFGKGTHHCLGSTLAREQGQIAFTSLLERFPEMRLVSDEIEWQPSPVLRSLKSLRVEL